MVNINDLFLAIIVKNKDYNENRYLHGINYDPFLDEDEVVSEFIGIPTIVLKNGKGYEDLLFSRYKNEIVYKLNEFNNLGIKLIYLKPFISYYPDYTNMPMIYEVPNNISASNLQEFMPYLFYPYDTTNGVYMILNDDAPLDDFYYDYRTKPYNPIRGNKCKKLVKN